MITVVTMIIDHRDHSDQYFRDHNDHNYSDHDDHDWNDQIYHDCSDHEIMIVMKTMIMIVW